MLRIQPAFSMNIIVVDNTLQVCRYLGNYHLFEGARLVHFRQHPPDNRSAATPVPIRIFTYLHLYFIMVLNERQYLDNLRSSGDVVFLGDPASPARISWAPVPDGNGFMAINDARPDEGAANLSLIGTISRSSFSLNSVWGFDIEHKRPWQVSI